MRRAAIENLNGTVKKLEGKQEYSAAKKVQRIIYSMYKSVYNAILRIVTIILEVAAVSWLSLYYIAEAIILSITPNSLRNLKSLRGRNILVTGGAGGVGQELVIRLAKFKANVIVWDINEKAMEQLKAKVTEEGYKIHTYVVDLSDRQNIYKNANIVRDEVGHIDILINNAGIVCGQPFLEVPDYMIEKTYQVNTLSCYWTAKAFLPSMIKRGSGHIATVGSLTGLLGCYNCTDYSGSKYAIIGFQESLWNELKARGHNGIVLTTVAPYFINTGMFDGCKPSHMPMLEPKEVAKRTILAIRREEFFCSIPGSSLYILALKNYIPTKLSWLFQHRVFRLPQAMQTMRKFQEPQAA
ncbi:short-chain dehydrogenase/reductase family 16C member 6 [Rhynchophorus ferrugineus]|uniref:short-chain dehydrogenase/reductase family 16C member 6 n=1 Tax=Rhynchophorus ferrugineus TaxID=354439 RepID=UPI003FCD7BB1